MAERHMFSVHALYIKHWVIMSGCSPFKNNTLKTIRLLHCQHNELVQKLNSTWMFSRPWSTFTLSKCGALRIFRISISFVTIISVSESRFKLCKVCWLICVCAHKWNTHTWCRLALRRPLRGPQPSTHTRACGNLPLNTSSNLTKDTHCTANHSSTWQTRMSQNGTFQTLQWWILLKGVVLFRLFPLLQSVIWRMNTCFMSAQLEKIWVSPGGVLEPTENTPQ